MGGLGDLASVIYDLLDIIQRQSQARTHESSLEGFIEEFIAAHRDEGVHRLSEDSVGLDGASLLYGTFNVDFDDRDTVQRFQEELAREGFEVTTTPSSSIVSFDTGNPPTRGWILPSLRWILVVTGASVDELASLARLVDDWLRHSVHETSTPGSSSDRKA